MNHFGTVALLSALALASTLAHAEPAKKPLFGGMAYMLNGNLQKVFSW